MRGSIIVAVLLVATISGCAVSKDPKQGGLLGGLYGINSGEYDARVKQRQDDLNNQQSRNRDFESKSRDLDAKVNIRSSQLAQDQDQLVQMEDNLVRLESDVDNLKTKSSAQQSEVKSLKRKLEKQRRQLKSQQAAIKELDNSGGITANPEQYRVMVKERNRLAEEYKRLVKYSQALSDAAN